MARSTLHVLLALCVCLTLACVTNLLHAQANRPLDVSANTTRNVEPSQNVSKDEMIRRARELARQAEAAEHRAIISAAPVAPSSTPTTPSTSAAAPSPARTTPATPAVNHTTDAAHVAEQARADSLPLTGATPPIVPVDPNESKPLGPSGTGLSRSGDSQSPGSVSGVTKTILALTFVVVLILIGRQLTLRWMGRPAAVNRSRAVEVLSRVSVGPKQHILLLRMGGRILVVADSAGQMRSLANIDEPEEVASILKSVTTSRPSSISQGFGQMLGRFDQEYEQDDQGLHLAEEGQDTAEFQVDKTRDQLNGLLARVRAMAGKGDA